MEGTDTQIIKELVNDARKTYREIADKLGVSEGTVYNHVSRLKEGGIIKRFTCDVHAEKLGYSLTSIIGIIVKGGHLLEVEEKIAKRRGIIAVYDITGDYDALVIAKFRDRSELNALVKGILSTPYVSRTYTMVVLNVVKEDFNGFLD